MNTIYTVVLSMLICVLITPDSIFSLGRVEKSGPKLDPTTSLFKTILIVNSKD